ncbi:unnamed protein product [Rodentolepis nana]|uniref:TIL domain-containing protein n=1 Tax=Rodentolepis nana TaxID=102285 RepID=A0A0R3TMZ2_RODNA|nr:unnamed protein product [Rodentolepis nana]
MVTSVTIQICRIHHFKRKKKLRNILMKKISLFNAQDFESNSFIHMLHKAVGVYISLTDYSNPTDKTYRGLRCDHNLFHWLDLCDPQFTITVNGHWGPERYKTIISHITPAFENSKDIHSVYSTRGEFDTLPLLSHSSNFAKAGSVEFGIPVNTASKSVTLVPTWKPADAPLGLTLRELEFYSSRLVRDVGISANWGFYGPRCEVECTPEPDWSCHPKTGARICTLPCNRGNCVVTEPLCVYSRHNVDPENCQGSSPSSSTLVKTGDTINGRKYYRVCASKQSQLPLTPLESEKFGVMESKGIYEDIDNDEYLDPKMTDTYEQLPIPPSPRS